LRSATAGWCAASARAIGYPGLLAYLFAYEGIAQLRAGLKGIAPDWKRRRRSRRHSI